MTRNASQIATEVLTRVARREEFLQQLAEEPLPKPALVERLDVSRSTVDRATRRFQETGLVTRTDDGYTLTTTGRALLDAYEQFAATADDLLAAESLLRHLPPDVAVDPAVVAGSEVVSPRDDSIYLPAHRIESLIEWADRVRGLARAYTQPDALDTYYREVVERGTDIDMVFQRSMYDQLASADDERCRALLDSDHVTAATVPEAPYGLFVLYGDGDGRRTCLIVYDEESVLRGCLINDGEAAADWAERRIAAFEERATPVNRD